MKTVKIEQIYSYTYQIIKVDRANNDESIEVPDLELSDAIQQHSVLESTNEDVNIAYYIAVDYEISG